MSLRVNRRHNSSKIKKPKKVRKPEWDDTLNDLTVYRATPDELTYRKLSHQSKNVDAVRNDQLSQSIHKARLKDTSYSSFERRKAAILKEVLFDQSQLQNTLAKSDKALGVVKDLFGDDPKRFTGFPNVTTAPNQGQAADLDQSINLVPGFPGKQTTLENMSSLMMNSSALNDIDNMQNSDSEEESNCFKSHLDLGRFRQFLSHEIEKNNQEQLRSSDGTRPIADENEDAVRDDGGSFLEHSMAEPPKIIAINDTSKVARVRSLITDGGIGDGDTYPKTELKQVLEGVEQCLPKPQTSTENSLTNQNFAQALLKVIHCLKETDRRLQTELTLRDQLSQDVFQLRSWVDALTGDIIACQEKYVALEQEYCQYRASTEDRITQLERLIKPDHVIQISQPVVRKPASPTQEPIKDSNELQSLDDLVQQLSKTALKNVTEPVVVEPAKLLSRPKQGNTPTRPAVSNLLSQEAKKHLAARVAQQQQSHDLVHTETRDLSKQTAQTDSQGTRDPENWKVGNCQGQGHLTNGLTNVVTGSENNYESDRLRSNEENLAIEQQLQELVRQHAEAQSKLKELQQNSFTAQTYPPDAVSPPLSPISKASTYNDMSEPINRAVNGASRGLVVTLPRAEDLSLSM